MIILLEEYRVLRAEIAQRVSNQLLILGGVVALSAAIIPLLQIPGLLVPLLLGAPLVYGLASWLYFEQDVFLTQAATYINKRLRLQIRRRVVDGEGLLEWEVYRNEILFRARANRVFLRIMTIFRLGATIGPGLASVVVTPHFALEAESIRKVPVWQLAIYTVDLLVVGLLIYQGVRIISLYRDIGEQEARPNA